MRKSYDSQKWYIPNRDGILEEYLKIHDEFSCFPLFKGYEQYELLWDKGYLIPGQSVIRLMWNIMREDEHFWVLSKTKLQGISNVKAHVGRPGIHNAKEILEETVWEAQSLNKKN